ncbi:MAG: putative selenate ABC transporter substrate-binding protein [SAR324 cluster bacterium]|nr:putative selenate ABC transporter substrate-binding protein [SAR324 cluster bacterium]
MKTFFTLILTLLLFAQPLSALELKFSAIPDQDTDRLEQRFSKVAKYLEKKLKIKVTYVPVKSYSASVSAFKNNQIQLSWFGGLSGVQARMSVAGSKAIAQGKEDQEFVTYIIAHHSTGLRPTKNFPKAIAGKTFTFGSKGSTSGRLMPEFYIRQNFNNQAPRKVFKRVGFSGDHSKTIALVQSGAYQVGAVNFQVYEQELKTGKIDPKKVSILWKTPSYPDYNWSIRGDVDAKYGKGFTKKVQAALLGITDPDLLASFPRGKFIKAENSLYDPIAKTAKAVGILR